MRPSTLIPALKDVIATGQPVFVWGPPGVGKSDITRQVAELSDLEYLDVRAVLLDPVDVRGLPIIVDGRAVAAIPGFLPTKGKGILHLDELPQATPLVQAALLQLVLDRKIGDYVLPEGWVVVASGNRAGDRAGGHKILSALNNRFLHLDLDVSVDDWRAWAVQNGVRPEVVSFIAARPELLHQFDPKVDARAFASPRSWSFVSRILASVNDGSIFDLVKGCVGDGAAAEFIAFVKVYKSLPDVDKVLAAPDKAPVPADADVLYAITGAITEKVRGNVKLADAAVAYVSRFQEEFAVKAFRDLVHVSKTSLTGKPGKEFIQKHRDLLI